MRDYVALLTKPLPIDFIIISVDGKSLADIAMKLVNECSREHHIHMSIKIPPKYSFSQILGYLNAGFSHKKILLGILRQSIL